MRAAAREVSVVADARTRGGLATVEATVEVTIAAAVATTAAAVARRVAPESRTGGVGRLSRQIILTWLADAL